MFFLAAVIVGFGLCFVHGLVFVLYALKKALFMVHLRLVAMGKIMEGDSIIHTVAYADDVVRVSVETVIDPEAEVPYATSEIQYVKQAVNTFVAWPTHLVKAVLDEVTCLI